MIKRFLPIKLRTRMTWILGVIALVQTGAIGWFAAQHLGSALDQQIGNRALAVAKTIAVMPEVVSAVAQGNTDRLQPLSLSLASESGAYFVVIGDRQGTRLAHPNPQKIGHSMMDDDDDDNSIVLVSGKTFVSKNSGSLGDSMRGKAPVFDAAGEQVIGVVSVGFLLNQVQGTIQRYQQILLAVVLVAFFLSVLMALWIANHFQRAIFGLEPEQIGQLFEERNATLESVREGIIAINKQGSITTVNKTAIETLGLSPAAEVIGEQLEVILPDSRMVEVLLTGEPQFDKEVWLNDKHLVVNRVPIIQDGQVLGAVSSFRPKDELDRVSKKLERTEQLADSLRSQAHEYSNKLHTLAGLIQMGATDDALELIGQESRNHQQLIRLLIEAVPDSTLAGCLLGKFNQARERNIHLRIDPDSHMVDIPPAISRLDLVSILGNLIDNAIDATLESLKNSSDSGQILLVMTDLGDELIFEVEDQGPGIPDDQLVTIFRKGVTSKSAEGHGYGLHLVRSLVDRLGGQITVEPGSQKIGTRFVVSIPKLTSSVT